MAARTSDITADDPRARWCELDGCGALIVGGNSWTAYAARRFCSREHTAAWRRAQPCPRCTERGCCDGQSWYEAPGGGHRGTHTRACACCKSRTEAARTDRRHAARTPVQRLRARPRSRPAPGPVSTPQPARPVWRPNAPGWAPIPERKESA